MPEHAIARLILWTSVLCLAEPGMQLLVPTGNLIAQGTVLGP